MRTHCRWRNDFKRRTPNTQLTSNEDAGGGARTHTTLRSLDFESSASANSATPASARVDTTKPATKLKFQSRFRLEENRSVFAISFSADRQHKQFCLARQRQISHYRDKNERARIHRENCWLGLVVTCAALLASMALAEDFKTVEGKEYKDVTVTRVEPDGIVLTTKTGMSKVYFAELPKDVQDRFLPTTPEISITRDVLIKSKSWAAAVKHSTSFVLLFVGVASVIAVGLFAIIRSRLQRPRPIRGSLTNRPSRSRTPRS